MKYFRRAKGMENNIASIPVAFIKVLHTNRADRIFIHSSFIYLSQRAGSGSYDS